MSSITTGIGLISGIDIASLIDSIITIESAGKFRMQSRIGELQAQQTALLDINARLLNFKSTADSFRQNRIFDAVVASSSNEDVLTASATNTAKPGSFDFIVKQLVSSSQLLTKGYATEDSTPLGLSQIAFEFGHGRVTTNRALEDLNGGNGVDRGRIVISDRNNDSATVDLTDVTTVDEVIDRINSTSGVSVTASIANDHIVITDTSGGANNLTITDDSGDTTATDLGIAQDVAGDTLTGTSIYFIGASTSLTTLNDGNGVLVRDNVDDFVITARDSTTISIDLGRIDLPIDDDTLLSDLNNGAGVTLNGDSEDADIKFVDRAGDEYEVDLTGVTTVGQLRSRIATATGGVITLSVTSGDRFTITDTSGGSLNLKIQGAGSNGNDTAEDLGILNEDGVAADAYTGDVVPAAIDQSAATTIQEVLDRINNDSENGGRIVASIGPDGASILMTDNTGGPGNLIVASTAANPSAAADLGIETPGVALPAHNGSRILGGLDSVLVSSLNGGSGLDGDAEVTFTDRDGVSTTIASLDLYQTLGEMIDAINAQVQFDGVQITASLNETGNGLKIVDTSGGTSNLMITGNAADDLGIEANVAADTVRGTNLQRRYVSHATRLDDLNYGRGIGTGSFRITDGIGQTTTVNIGGSEKTIYDILLEINAANPSDLAVKARINDNGDGIIIEEDPVALAGRSPSVRIKVESLNGTSAGDLGLLGEADGISDPIDGSYERVVDLSASDSLESAATKINDAGIPVSVSVVNTGGGATPYRLSIASEISGSAGDLTVDLFGGDVGLTTLGGEDAKVFFGSDDPEDAFLVTSSTNTIDNVLSGVSIDLHSVSDAPVTLAITRDEEAVITAATSLATTFNDAIGRLDQYDFFDVETEEKGLLLGNATVASVRSALYRIATGSTLNVGGSYSNLFQVGYSFNSKGEMQFDAGEFREAYAADPQGVEDLFAKYAVSTTSSEQVSPGITVQKSNTTFTALGFGDLFSNALEDLTNSIDGVVTLADTAFDSQIDLLQDRIAFLDLRLESRREQLLREFTAMETTLARLQNQSSALGQIAGNVALASARFS